MYIFSIRCTLSISNIVSHGKTKTKVVWLGRPVHYEQSSHNSDFLTQFIQCSAAFYNLYEEGDGLGWHFDKGAFGVNLILQNPEKGGAFEYHPNTRSDDDPWAFERVEKILSGSTDGVEAAGDVRAGSLIIFAGRQSLHRVSPVEVSSPVCLRSSHSGSGRPSIIVPASEWCPSRDTCHVLPAARSRNQGHHEPLLAAPPSPPPFLALGAGRCPDADSGVQGCTPRINAILHFEPMPGQKLGAYSLKRFFGRG